LLILGAVKRNPLTAAGTDHEIEQTIMKWLRFAGDRDGGRKKREDNAKNRDILPRRVPT